MGRGQAIGMSGLAAAMRFHNVGASRAPDGTESGSPPTGRHASEARGLVPAMTALKPRPAPASVRRLGALRS